MGWWRNRLFSRQRPGDTKYLGKRGADCPSAAPSNQSQNGHPQENYEGSEPNQSQRVAYGSEQTQCRPLRRLPLGVAWR